MEPIAILPLSPDNLPENALDEYERRQDVTECWRQVDGEWKLIPLMHHYDWSLEKRRATVQEIIDVLQEGGAAFGAFHGGKLIGFSVLSLDRFGSALQYVQLHLLQISAPYRGRGVGRQLFERAAAVARAKGVPKLYISANSSRESQAAYRKLGCTYAAEVDPRLAALEPFDVQMEYVL